MIKTAISLFSGMGGDTLGMLQAGVNVIAYSEHKYRDIHEKNIKNCRLLGKEVKSDITKIENKELQKYKGKADLIFAGFPCQGFSHAGKKKINDPRNTLFKEFLRATKIIKPKYIIGENVTGLLTRKTNCSHDSYSITNDTLTCKLCGMKRDNIKPIHLQLLDKKIKNVDDYRLYLTETKDEMMIKQQKIKNELKTSKKKKEMLTKEYKKIDKTIHNRFKNVVKYLEETYISVIKREFEQIGYIILYKVLKASDYNVPQNRKRLIILGKQRSIQKELSFPPEQKLTKTLKSIVSFNMTGSFKLPAIHNSLIQTIQTKYPESILVDLHNDEKTQNPHPFLKLRATDSNFTYDGKTHPTLLSFGKRSSGNHCEIINLLTPSKTIICTYEHQPRLFVLQQNKNGFYIRCLLPDELKQIQGFPPSYQLTGSTKKQIIQIGNAIPPPMIKAIVQHLNTQN